MILTIAVIHSLGVGGFLIWSYLLNMYNYFSGHHTDPLWKVVAKSLTWEIWLGAELLGSMLGK